ncbi:MAG: MraY family glycosyltransferase [Oceanipulchritudo sp.]
MVITSVTQLILFVSGLAVSLAATAILTMVVKRLALRWNLVDQPNNRSVHRNPIPRIGGIAIVGGFAVGLAYFFGLRMVFPHWNWIIDFPDKWILLGAGMMFALGLADDLFNIKPRIKLFFQALAAFTVVAAGFRFQIPFLYFQELGFFNEVIAAAITFIWIIGIINAINLMDGMDGLAAGMGVIAISSLTVALALNGYGADLVLVTAFIGALVGFLLYNSHPASIFMGDSGSLFLGFILATFSLPASGAPVSGLTYLVPILALGLPILDTLTAIVRRAVQGRGIFTADRDHIHHRLLKSNGESQRSTVFTLYAVNAIFGVMAIMVLGSRELAQVVLVLSLASIFCLLFLLKLGYIQIKQEDAAPTVLPSKPKPETN